jgi:glucosamine--fructose-6-phosphate aminotransferase (isomerizing)
MPLIGLSTRHTASQYEEPDMCGIIACRGADAGRITLEGLKHLEYRGYDSAGIAVVDEEGHLEVVRAVGKLDELMEIAGSDEHMLAATTAIGHTRWATHGAVTLSNSHPVSDCTGRVAVVHNGVLENVGDLRSELSLRGHRFSGNVDSEVIAHLIEEALVAGLAPLDAMRKTVAQLQGSWAIAAIVEGCDGLVLARQGSPLLVRGDQHQFVVASDAPATAEVSGPLRTLSDGDVVELGEGWRWIGVDGADALPEPLEDAPAPATTKPRTKTARQKRNTADSAMALEIAEQSEVAANLVNKLLQSDGEAAGWYRLGLPSPRRVQIVACGSSYFAGLVIARTLRVLAGVQVDVTVASEFEPRGTEYVVANRPWQLDEESDAPDLMIAISQSGETADVLRAVDGNRSPLVAITNSTWSSLAQRADAVLDCAAGVERGVAATKSFTAQVIVGIGLALSLAHVHGHHEMAERARSALRQLPGQLARADARASDQLHPLIDELADRTGWLFLGSGTGLPYAAEGALKLKEVTYRWAQSYPASELKHGPLALVEQGTPVVVVDNGLARLEMSISEVTSRGARVIRVGGPRSEIGPALVGDDPPWGPLAAVVSLQHLARELGVVLHRDVDRPRNLAKSVTVV